MDTRFVDRVLSGNRITRRYYMGCFPSDHIPTCVKYPCSMVVNLDPSGRKGSHWVAIYCVSSIHAYYFDSLGIAPFGLIKNYLQRFRRITRNKKPYQSVVSDYCGYYSIVFIYFCSLGKSFNFILKVLNRCVNTDLFVKEFVYLMAK